MDFKIIQNYCRVSETYHNIGAVTGVAKKGFFHGYSVKANKDILEMMYEYHDDCLESEYLVTSSETW